MRSHSTRHSSCQLSLIAVAAGVSALLPAAPDAVAQPAPAAQHAEASRHYDLPPAPLADTLQAIARVSKRPIEFDAASLGDARASAVTGEFTVSQALAQALAGTTFKVTEKEGVLKIDASAIVELQKVVILAKRDEAETSFKADRSDTATRSGTNLMDLPGSVTIVTSKVLETQQAPSIRDALANVSGVTFQESPQGRPSLAIRGFEDTNTLVNGVFDSSAALTNVFAVERVEVLKGPQAILSGSNSLGGSVNIVTKKPQAAPIRTVLAQYASHEDVTLAGDIAGPVSDDKKLTYRLIASTARAKNSEAGFDGREDDSVLPQLRWKDSSTDVIAGLSYAKQRMPLPRYTSARRDGALMQVPDLLLGRPQDGFDSEQRRAFYQLDQKISPGTTFVSRFQYATSKLYLHVRTSGGVNYDEGAPPDSPNGQMDFFASRSRLEDRNTAGDHYLRVEGNTGSLGHKLSVGLNHVKVASTQSGWDGDYVPGVQVYPPDRGFEFPDVELSGASPSWIFQSKGSQVGLFAQDLMSWGDWNVLVNLRRNRYTTSSASTFIVDGVPDTFVEDKKKLLHTSPGIGVIYNVTPQVSVYANYAEGFAPQFVQRCGGGMVDPQLSRNREVGAKFDLFDSKLSVTTAAFELAQSNTLQYSWQDNCANVLEGQVTRGLEIDLQGQLARGWNAMLNYAYKALKDVGDPNRIFTGQPRHKVSLWTTYDLQGDDWRGFGFGAGLNATSRANGEARPQFAFTTPGQAQVDLTAYYTKNKWSAMFGVKNVFDRLLYETAANFTYVPLRDGRTFTITIKRDFD